MTISKFLGTIVLAFSMTPSAWAGGIAGGGGPPSKDLLKLRLILDQDLTSEITLHWDGILPDPVNVVNLEGDTRSYRVHEGQQKGTLILIDRREEIRDSVKKRP